MISKLPTVFAFCLLALAVCAPPTFAQGRDADQRRTALNDALHAALTQQGEISFKEASSANLQSIWVRHWTGRGCNVEYARIARTDGYYCPQSNYQTDMIAVLNLAELSEILAVPRVPEIQPDGTVSDFSYYQSGEIRLRFRSPMTQTRRGCRGDPAFNTPTRFQELVIPVREDRLGYVVEALTKLKRSCTGLSGLPELPE